MQGMIWRSRGDDLTRRPNSCVGAAGSVPHQIGTEFHGKSTQIDASWCGRQ